MVSGRVYTLLVALLIAGGSLSYGYCFSVITTTLGQPLFLAYFGLDEGSPNAVALTSLIVVIYPLGGWFGTISASGIADRLGRRKALGVACLGSIVTGAIQSGSVNFAMFVVFRFLGGVSTGQFMVYVPLYLSEVAPPKIRGALMSLNGVMIGTGYSIAAWTNTGFYFASLKYPGASWPWRLPLVIQTVWPILLLAGIFFAPESPRWLALNGRKDEALEILTFMHGSSDDVHGDLPRQEYDLLIRQELIDRTQEQSWASLWTKPSYRKRTILGFATMMLFSSTGALVIVFYLPAVLARLEFDTPQQLLLTGGYLTTTIFWNAISGFLADRFGRRACLAAGVYGMAATLLAELVCVAVGVKGQAAAVVFIFLNIAVFGSFLDATTYTFASEIWPNHLRAKGFSISVSGLFVGATLWLGVGPTAFAGIGYYFYLIFIIMDLAVATAVLKYWPETNGLALEEIGALFGDKVTGDDVSMLHAEKPDKSTEGVEQIEHA